MSRYEWTDWIAHTPGQELPIGLYIMAEHWGSRTNGGRPYIEEGLLSPRQRGHGSWHARNPDGDCSMIIRYRIRIVVDEAEASAGATTSVRETV